MNQESSIEFFAGFTFRVSIFVLGAFNFLFSNDLGTDAQRSSGKYLYLQKCSQCHGTEGKGDGDGATFFKPLPRNFTSGAFKIRTTESGELPTDTDLKSIIKKGMPYTGMPAWPSFTEEQLTNLVYYIKGFNSDFADTSIHPKQVEMVKAPAFSPQSLQKGRALYEENKCLDCHGKWGRGDGESAPTLKDDWGNAIRPADLTQRWTFRGGPTREDIYRTFMTGLNGTPMPSYASSIAGKDRWVLVDYIYSLSNSDVPDYASLVEAQYTDHKIEIEKVPALFEKIKPALFPVVGQVVEGQRNFFPEARCIEVKAIFDSLNIAILVSWHDMTAEKQGSNQPNDEVANKIDTSSKVYSDAIALQIPSKPLTGATKPYFIFGDKKNPVDVWFADLAKDSAQLFTAKGSEQFSLNPTNITVKSEYSEGEWKTIFIRPRQSSNRLSIEEAAFIPIAFSIWDGRTKESGSRHGMTSWYTLYLKPSHTQNPMIPATKRAAMTLAFLLVIIWVAKKRLQGSTT